jgi:hypothetical protein
VLKGEKDVKLETGDDGDEALINSDGTESQMRCFVTVTKAKINKRERKSLFTR